jgi:predicted DNA-binding antitoxin AbrB/MazE fold protein
MRRYGSWGDSAAQTRKMTSDEGRQREKNMTLNTTAVYENGLLRPTRPLPLREGETVAITLNRATPADSQDADDEAVRRIQGARDLQEWIDAANKSTEEEDGYDLLRALDENRKGERPLFPPELKGISW